MVFQEGVKNYEMLNFADYVCKGCNFGTPEKAKQLLQVCDTHFLPVVHKTHEN